MRLTFSVHYLNYTLLIISHARSDHSVRPLYMDTLIGSSVVGGEAPCALLD